MPAAQRRLIARLQRLIAASRPLKEWPLGESAAAAAEWSAGGGAARGGASCGGAAASKAASAAVARLLDEESTTHVSDTSSTHGDVDDGEGSE